jgi:hypothetical protein
MSDTIKSWLDEIEIPKYAQQVILTYMDDLLAGSCHDIANPEKAVRVILRILKGAVGATIDENGLMSTGILGKNIKRILLNKDHASPAISLLDDMADALQVAAKERQQRSAGRRLTNGSS